MVMAAMMSAKLNWVGIAPNRIRLVTPYVVMGY
jgi:hypothetical protein